MHRALASLAALFVLAAAGCGGDEGAEPGAPSGAARALTLVLDFQPNAVHAGIYTALERGHLAERGIDLTIREPGASTDAPKLLRAGRADLAILDIHDLAIARERGADLVGVGAVVQRPLAAVIAADRSETRRPADLSGDRVGVTGLPSDDAVLEAVLEAGGADPANVRAVTTGFDSVAALSAGRVAAATAFWNAEGVELKRLGVPTREFRVDDFGAPRYPELILVSTRDTLESRGEEITDLLAGLREGTEIVVDDPATGLDALLGSVSELDRESQQAQLDALIDANAFSPPIELDPGVLERWAQFDAEHGIVAEAPDVDQSFSSGIFGAD